MLSTISENMQLENSLMQETLPQLNIERKCVRNVMRFSDFESIILDFENTLMGHTHDHRLFELNEILQDFNKS